jgi:REP element-mobilizing transposase RayT
MMTENQHPAGTSKTIGSIVRGFKIGVTKQIGYSIWQRNYYEHIIRDANDYARIASYTVSNPAKWTDDTFYTE